MALFYDDMIARTFQNRLQIYGKLSQLRKALKESVNDNAQFDLASIMPPPPHLSVDTRGMKPYGEYADQLFLRIFLSNKQMNMKAMLRDERDYLDRHREIKAGPYLRAKERFLKDFANITEEEFYQFYRNTRPFSSFIASRCLDEAFAHYHHDPDSFLGFIAAQEEAYLQSQGTGISMARWEESKERFQQAFRPDSPAFKDFKKSYWGVTEPAENSSISICDFDRSAQVAFTTVGGVPDKVIAALAEKYPGLIIVHYWNDVERPQNHGCVTYNSSRKIAA